MVRSAVAHWVCSAFGIAVVAAVAVAQRLDARRRLATSPLDVLEPVGVVAVELGVAVVVAVGSRSVVSLSLARFAVVVTVEPYFAAPEPFAE